MVPARFLFPGVPGGVELLVILLVMLVLLGLPLFLLAVGGLGFWKLSRGDGDGRDDETVEELRRRVDDLEAQLSEADVGAEADADGSADRSGSGSAPNAPPTDEDRSER